MQQRYYDPMIPRFLSVDPVTAYSDPVGAFHRYRYANNNPYLLTDPDGRQSCSDACLKMRNASDRVGSGIEGMTRWGIERVFSFVNKQAEKHTFSSKIGAVTYFGSWAIPLQRKFKVEVGANLSEIGDKFKVSDFHPGSSGSVDTWNYQGPGQWSAILHTHPGTAGLSGAGVEARAITGHGDVGQAALRGVDAYVIKNDYTIQRLNYQAWMKIVTRIPGNPHMQDGSMTIYRHLTKTAQYLVFVFVLSSCSSNLSVADEGTSPIAADTARMRDCEFRAAAFAGKACKVPFVAILANPEKYAGKRVFTYAYMIKEKDETNFTFLSEPRVRSVPDFASCVFFGSQNELDDKKLSDIQPGMIYSVSFAATFSTSRDYMCAGIFDEVDFQDAALELAIIQQQK